MSTQMYNLSNVQQGLHSNTGELNYVSKSWEIQCTEIPAPTMN